MGIHPTAIVDTDTTIHETAEIGPFQIIESGVQIGEGTIIAGSGRIHSGTQIGKRNQIFHGTVIGAVPQHLQFDATTKTQVLIGDDNTLREYCNIHRSSLQESPTRIGNHNYLMGGVHLGHDCSIGHYNILAQNCLLGGHVIVGDRIFISAMVGIHQFCRIGDYALLGGQCKVTEDIPPFVTVDGNPAEITGLNEIGMRRSGLSENERRGIKTVFKKVFRSRLSLRESLNELSAGEPSSLVSYFIDFVRNSERGIAHYVRH